jgi:hypothetical protein
MASGKGRGTGVADLTRRRLIDTPPPSRVHSLRRDDKPVTSSLVCHFVAVSGQQ